MVKKKISNSTNLQKEKIIRTFLKQVKGKSPNTTKANRGHDGKEGHWLEVQMGIKHNASNEPDLFGFEMKNNTTSKTTFGDWSADYYIYKDTNYFESNKVIHNRDRFMVIFGGSNPEYEGRYSWSGKSAPKVGKFNDFGQKLIIDKSNNIIALYTFSSDKRVDKKEIVPKNLQKEAIILAKWNAESLRKKVENKFNKEGWFKCLKDKKSGRYSEIVFGAPINFRTWIKGVKDGLIYFDSGMHIGNKRPYSNWRADNKYWNSLITDRY